MLAAPVEYPLASRKIKSTRLGVRVEEPVSLGLLEIQLQQAPNSPSQADWSSFKAIIVNDANEPRAFHAPREKPVPLIDIQMQKLSFVHPSDCPTQ